MNGRLVLFSWWLPYLAHQRGLREIRAAVGRALGGGKGVVSPTSRRETLADFARWSREQVEAALSQGREQEAMDRLFLESENIGRRLRESLGIRHRAEVVKTARLLYRVLDIDLRGYGTTGIVIHTCFFSRHYSSRVCRVMEAMDRGLFAGLSGGETIVFFERLTEGYGVCRAVWDKQEDIS